MTARSIRQFNTAASGHAVPSEFENNDFDIPCLVSLNFTVSYRYEITIANWEMLVSG